MTVAVAATPDPVVFEGDFAWTGSLGDATVHERVTATSDAEYKWSFNLHNDSYIVGQDGFWGFASLYVGTDEAGVVTASGGDYGAGEVFSGSMLQAGPSVRYGDFGNEFTPGLVIGQSANFWYTTEPRPLVAAAGSVWEPGVSDCAAGELEGPSLDVKADIDIAGKIKVGVTETVFTEENEDTIGGLVVRKADNKAPRQQITIQPLRDAGGQPVVGGKVEVIWGGGKMDLYDAAAGGNKVPSGTLYDNVAGVLPKQLWVEGTAGSGAMKDVKIKAVPVGNPNGGDDVSFTVLWVDVTVATDGKISANNDKRQPKIDTTLDAAGKKADALGISTTFQLSAITIGWALEGQGLVHPADFNYPGSDLRLRRVWDRQGYITPPGAGKTRVLPSIAFKDDTSLPELRDDNPLDSCGYIYDIEYPGIEIDSPNAKQPQGTVWRFRANFKETAAIAIYGTNTRASGTYSYYVRFSLVQTGAGIDNTWAVKDPPDIAGDKKAFGPDQTKLSVDLS